MTLEQLKMLQAVAREGTLKAAGDKIFKTQAAISQAIKQLERYLGVTLFDRRGYRLVLTVEGEKIVQLAHMLLDKASEIERLSEHLTAGNEASITFVVNASFEMSIIIPVLEQIQDKFPDTQIIIRQEYLTGAIEKLDQEIADLVITPASDATIKQNDYDSFLLSQGSSTMVAAPKLLSRHPELKSVKELAKEYQIVIQDSGMGTKGITYGVEDGQRCWFLNDLHTKKTLLINGMGWGALPTHMIESELESGTLKKLVFEDAGNEFELDYYVLKQRNRLLGPVASLLWELLKATQQ